jgi:hypothetical protein
MAVDTVGAGDAMKRSGGRRFAGIAIGCWLACTIVSWNVVFDRQIRAAEQRYLALQAHHHPGVTIRAVMDPAIHDAAVAAMWWAGVPTGAGLLGAVIAARLVRTRARETAASGLRAGRR